MKGITWERNDGVVLGQIDMRKARKLFADGKPFYIAMENERPDFAIEITEETFAGEENFDKSSMHISTITGGGNWDTDAGFT